MTIRFIAKCDLCGQEHELGWSRELTASGQLFEKPDGWDMLNYETYNSPTSVALHMKLMICPDCDKAIRSGVDIVSAHQQAEMRKAMEAMKDMPLLPMMEAKE